MLRATMTLNRRAWIYTMGILLPAVVADPAAAQSHVEFPGHTQCRARSVEVIISGRSGSFDIAVAPNQITTVNFLDDIQIHEARWLDDGFSVKRKGKSIEIIPLASVKSDAVANVPVETSKYLASIGLHIAEDPRMATTTVDVKHESDIAAQKAEVEQAKHQAELEMLQATAMRMLEAPSVRLMRPIQVREPIDDTSPATVELLDAEWIGQYLLVPFSFENRVARRYRMAEVVAQTESRSHPATVIYLERGPEPKEGFIASVDFRHQLRGVVAVRVDGAASIEQLRLEFREANGLRPIVAQVQEWESAEEQWRKIEAEQEARKRKKQRARQVIVGVRAHAGGYWIADGLDQDQRHAAALTGVGVHITKGVSELLAFEAEIMGARTGDASFDNVLFNGVQGDLTRSASLGRVTLGGILRFGDMIAPNGRWGAGVQGASYSSQFTTGGATMTGPTTSFEPTAFVTFGAGLDFRLGQQFIAGIAASVVHPLGDPPLFSTAWEAGIHVGYGWNLSSFDPRE